MNILKHVFSKTTGSIELKFHTKIPHDKLAIIYTICFGLITKMATMPIYGKNHLKIPERTRRRMNLGFVCSIGKKSPTKIAQMMILG